MPNRLNFTLRVASSALVFFGYLALGSVRHYGPGLVLIPMVLLPLAPLGELLERRFQLYRASRRALVLVYLCFIPFSVSMYGLMDAVVMLVMFIQAWLLLGEKTARGWYEIYLMAFFLLLASVVQSPEPMIAFALLLFGMSAVWAFTALHMRVELDQSPARALPELRPLGGGALSARPGNMVDFGFVLTLVVLSVLSVVLTVSFFLLTPRVEAGWLGRRDPQQAITGLSETVQLTGDASIYEDETVVMHAQFPDEEDGRFTPESALYWRVSTLSRFSENEWSRRGLQYHYAPDITETLTQPVWPGWQAYAVEKRRAQRPDSRDVRQIIYMDDVPSQGIPALDLPRGVRVIGDAQQVNVSWEGSNDFVLQLQIRGSRRLRYEAWSDMVAHSPARLRAAPHDYDFMAQRDYSILTYHELLPETQALVRDLTDGHQSAYDKVMALEAWLSGPDFSYSLDVPPLPATHAVDYFIREGRLGHCELFASALALMARSLGVPARVVSGYRGGDYSANDQAYLVRASMAHLWVEVLYSGVGWVRMDPSPRSDATPSALRRMRMAWSDYTLRSKMFWYQSVIGFESGIRLDQWRWPWQRKRRPGTLAHATPEQQDPGVADAAPRDYAALFRHPGVFVTALFALLYACVAAWRKWRLARAAAPQLTADQRQARRLYLRFARKARAYGVNCDNQTATEIAAAVMERRQHDSETIRAFVRWYHAVRFGGRPLTKAQRQAFARFTRSL